MQDKNVEIQFRIVHSKVNEKGEGRESFSVRKVLLIDGKITEIDKTAIELKTDNIEEIIELYGLIHDAYKQAILEEDSLEDISIKDYKDKKEQLLLRKRIERSKKHE